MPEASQPSYDLTVSCPLARWREPAEKQYEYAAGGLPPCAKVSNENKEDFGWQFRVTCSVSKQSFASRCDTSQACIGQAVFWLNYLSCPGKIEPAP